VDQEKLFVHFISKYGFSIDPKRVEATSRITIPSNIKKCQAFLNQINVLRRFIQDFTEIVHPITELFKDKVPFK